MKLPQLLVVMFAALETAAIVVMYVHARQHVVVTPPQSWTEITNVAGGYTVACPADYRVELDGAQLLCHGPYGTHASVRVGSTDVATARAFVANANAHGFVGAEMTIVGTRDLHGVEAVVTTETGVEGRQMTVVHQGHWYLFECDFGPADIERFFTSLRFQDAL